MDDHRPWMGTHFLQPLSCNDAIGHRFPGTAPGNCKRKPQNQLRDFQRNADLVEPPGLSPTELQWFVKLFHHAINVHQSVGPYQYNHPLPGFSIPFFGRNQPPGFLEREAYPISVCFIGIGSKESNSYSLGVFCHLRSGC